MLNVVKGKWENVLWCMGRETKNYENQDDIHMIFSW